MTSPTGRDPGLETLLAYLKESRGFDFTGYKRASLARRIDKRMQDVRIASYADYCAYLAERPAEVERLFDTILINVTSFFRDEAAWAFLRREVVPRLVAQKGEDEPIRVWSAACATGEEAYTLAILFAEALGRDELRNRVKVYATDVDESALAKARRATYGKRDTDTVPAAILERYFEPVDGRMMVCRDVRRSVVFGRNDLIQDAPISRIDLLACRNALMYFDTPTQARIIDRFRFALNDGGFLFLGRAETLVTHGTTFAPVEPRRRIFQKVALHVGGRFAPSAPARSLPETPAPPASPGLLEAVLRSGAAAQLVVDRSGSLVLANDRANALFGLGVAELGRRLSELEVWHRSVDVRTLIDQAYAERRTVVRSGLEWRSPGTGEHRWLDLQVSLVHDADGTLVGTTLAFADVTAQRLLQMELEQSERALEAAYEKLHSTSERLETTTEELQSTVEELETTNEELQSSNEELHTMNEELQATNAELQTMNSELQLHGDRVDPSRSGRLVVTSTPRRGQSIQ